MSLIALFSDKGSPGVTTLALTLAVTWPRPVALVECDPAGGDLVLRLTDPAGHPLLRAEPGLLTLAVATRHGDGATSVAGHGQPVAGFPAEAVVLVGATSPEQGAGLVGLWPAIAAALAGTDGSDVLVDLGRLHPGSPALAVAEAADVLIGVTRACPEGMLRLRDRFGNLLAALPPAPVRPRRAAAVLITPDRRAQESVTAMRSALEHAALPVTVEGYLAFDPDAVDAMHAGLRGGRLNRSLLLRSALGLTQHLTAASQADAPSDASLPAPRRRRLASRVGPR